MSTATTKPRATTVKIGMGSGGVSGPPGHRDGGGGGRGPLPARAYRMGMAFGLAGIAMLFVALTSAYVVRQGLDPDWRAIRMPAILWANTILLLVSSFTFEKARRARKPAGWLAGTLGLGVAFLGGQFAAWLQLSSSGIYLGTNPHSSFFYLLTGLHAAHVLGGLAALTYLVGRSVRLYKPLPGRGRAERSKDPGDTPAALRKGLIRRSQPGVSPDFLTAAAGAVRVLDATALYWHFMDALWVYLFLLLFAWR